MTWCVLSDFRIRVNSSDVQQDPIILTTGSMKAKSEVMDLPHGPCQLALSRHALEREGALWFVVRGSSMRPFLRSGDRVLIRPCPADALGCGDLVLFTRESVMCLHRVITTGKRSSHPWVRTKGDGCGRWDPPLTVESIIGKGVMVQRGNRLQTLDTQFVRLANVFRVGGSIFLGWGLWVKWRLQH